MSNSSCASAPTIEISIDELGSEGDGNEPKYPAKHNELVGPVRPYHGFACECRVGLELNSRQWRLALFRPDPALSFPFDLDEAAASCKIVAAENPRLWDSENFSRIGIFHLAARRIATHVDIFG